jgi:hypothetical protein
MQAQEIETYLVKLDQELANERVQHSIRMLLVGGAFMLTQIHNRSATDDIDVLLKDVEDTTASPLYQTFRNAVRIVASKNRLPVTWINDVIGDFIRDTSAVPEGVLWRKYTILEIYVPPGEYILALKLLAGRPKDINDIEALSQRLHIHTRKQAQQLVDQYIPNKQVQQMNHLDITLSNFFHNMG